MLQGFIRAGHQHQHTNNSVFHRATCELLNLQSSYALLSPCRKCVAKSADNSWQWQYWSWIVRLLVPGPSTATLMKHLFLNLSWGVKHLSAKQRTPGTDHMSSCLPIKVIQGAKNINCISQVAPSNAEHHRCHIWSARWASSSSPPPLIIFRGK